MQNSVQAFIQKQVSAADVGKYGDPKKFFSLIATPRFKASSHLIFFIFSGSSRSPVLVAKVPRIPGDHERLEREAENLRTVQTVWSGGTASVPQVVAFEDYAGHRMLVETALAGQTMRPSFVRNHKQLALSCGADWLTNIHLHSIGSPADRTGWFNRIVRIPLQLLERLADGSQEDYGCLERTREIAESLADDLPAVFEHGDFGSPNLLIDDDHNLGVVDWELAEPQGLPAVDLFFFLSYVAFARADAVRLGAQMAAFETAFWGKEAWVVPAVTRYFSALDLTREAAGPLFVICWARYVASLLGRLDLMTEAGAQNNDPETLAWVRSNRYYHMWRRTIAGFDKLRLLE